MYFKKDRKLIPKFYKSSWAVILKRNLWGKTKETINLTYRNLNIQETQTTVNKLLYPVEVCKRYESYLLIAEYIYTQIKQRWKYKENGKRSWRRKLNEPDK